eukprot:gnl/MRDRNA2_/MRDRNA2_85689_c0_seq1.p1 gnl/MRDRNA2_/MRDRNA2_85689_c0~~gnl/MRDRNA2_/MRDRNA2_85689_c0_seq1.p1  ORF type:complete len:400 (-),score=93.99 gnl/MRDRNA2_/MRDRNA2_85689_c0_seq1:178-1377(-)
MLFMGIQKNKTSKACIAAENAGSLPNLLSLQRHNDAVDKKGGNATSLSLWRTVAKAKKLEEAREEARQRLSEKERTTIKETTLSRAMGLQHVKEQQNKTQAAPRDDVRTGSTTWSSDDDKDNQHETLLWVSAPTFAADTTRQFTMTIGRSSTKQRFGLTFTAKVDGKIIVAEDAKQFGIVKGDVVLGINGCSQMLTVEKVMHVMKHSLKIELSLLRIAYQPQSDQGKSLNWLIDQKSSWTTRQGVRCVDLLTVSSPRPLPEGPEDQFTIRLSRAIGNLKFGLDLRSVNTDPTGYNLTSKVYCAEDMPHLGLKKDDHILSVDGHEFRNVTECQHLLNTGMSVELLVKRHGESASEEPGVWNPENFEMGEENEAVEATIEDDFTVPLDDEPMVCAPKISLI